MVTCTVCKGAKEIQVRVNGQDPIAMSCHECGGSGEISDEHAADLERMDKAWCQCETPSEPYFVGDGEDSLIGKHHWRCRACGGVTQVG